MDSSHRDELRQKIYQELRTYVRTPWQHAGRLKRNGIDCIGLALVAADMAGVTRGRTEREMGIPNYGNYPHKDTFRKFMDTNLIQIEKEQLKVADLVFIAWRTYPMHLGLLGSFNHEGVGRPFVLIHTSVELGQVVEEQFDPDKPNRQVVGYYRLPTLDD